MLPDIISSSPVDVLKKYNATLQKMVSDPERLATELVSRSLLSDKFYDDLLSTQGLSRYRKNSLIMNELIQRGMPGGNEIQKFRTLCEILRKDCSDQKRKAVLKMEEEVVGLTVCQDD